MTLAEYVKAVADLVSGDYKRIKVANEKLLEEIVDEDERGNMKPDFVLLEVEQLNN